MFFDARGVAVKAASSDSVSLLDTALLSYAAFKTNTGDRLKAALASDPSLVMAPVLRGYFLLLIEKRELVPRALDAANTTEAAMEKFGATPRERRHASALRLWGQRDLSGAATILTEILAEEPRDLLALKLVQYLLFYAGDWRAMRDAVETTLDAWDAKLARLWLRARLPCFRVGGMRRLRRGGADPGRRADRALPRRHLGGTRRRPCLRGMEDRIEDGIRWLDEASGGWREDANNFAFHVAWHRCLFLLELGNHDLVLALALIARYGPESSDELLDITNAVSLLWRLEQLGIDVGQALGRAREALGEPRRGSHADLRRCALRDGPGSRGRRGLRSMARYQRNLCSKRRRRNRPSCATLVSRSPSCAGPSSRRLCARDRAVAAAARGLSPHGGAGNHARRDRLSPRSC